MPEWVVTRMKQHAPEAARVIQAYGMLTDLQLHMIVRAQGRLPVHDAQTAGHSEVHNQGTLTRLQENVFSAPCNLLHGLAAQLLWGLHGPTQCWVVPP